MARKLVSRLPIVILIANFSILCSGLQADELESFVDSIAEQGIDSKKYVGLSIGVARGDQVLLSKGYGLADIENSVPASRKSVYRIGSITKQFTAAAIMLLAEDEKLALDDTVDKWLTEFLKKEHCQRITIRHLLQHTSGIKSFTGLPSYLKLMRHDVRHADIMGRIRDMDLEFDPGSKYRYSNSGYYLLGIIVEKASEQSFEEFVQTRLLGPLKLKSTAYDRHAKLIMHRARGYNRFGDRTMNASYLSMSQPFSAGAMVSTTDDLIRWTKALHHGKVMSDDSYAAMTQRGKLSDGSRTNYGLGTVIGKQNGTDSFGHGGGINGFLSDLVYLPEHEITVVVLSNCTASSPAKIRSQILNHLLASTPDE